MTTTDQATTMQPTATLTTKENAMSTSADTNGNASTNVASPSTPAAAPPPPPGTGLKAIVAQISAELDAAEVALGPEPPATTPAGKRRTLKVPRAALKVVTLLAPIVQQHRLDSPGLSAQTMLDLYDTSQTLLPLQARLAKMKKRIDDSIYAVETQSWSMALQFYALLQRLAKNDGSIAAALVPIAKDFAYRHRSVKQTKPTKLQTRARAAMKHAVGLVTKHGVAPTPPETPTGAPPPQAPSAPATPPTPTVTPASAAASGAAPPPVATGAAAPAAPNGAGH
jgi:hypothetical protein